MAAAEPTVLLADLAEGVPHLEVGEHVVKLFDPLGLVLGVRLFLAVLVGGLGRLELDPLAGRLLGEHLDHDPVLRPLEQFGQERVAHEGDALDECRGKGDAGPLGVGDDGGVHRELRIVARDHPGRVHLILAHLERIEKDRRCAGVRFADAGPLHHALRDFDQRLGP